MKIEVELIDPTIDDVIQTYENSLEKLLEHQNNPANKEIFYYITARGCLLAKLLTFAESMANPYYGDVPKCGDMMYAAALFAKSDTMLAECLIERKYVCILACIEAAKRDFEDIKSFLAVMRQDHR